ncbi:MAG TPA: indole-3-glycerol phosphate synthase TrpC [Polyangiaceae bacterium]|nr:indole-3-glycerol phosphate synthase TrpC [Polyangiaceae bacterium]
MSFLDDILRRKRDEVAERRREVGEAELEARAARAPTPQGLFERLSPPGGPARVIAEVKRASPSAGAIRADLDAVTQARRYAEGGAVAISVLTDGPGFGGSLADLEACREAVSAPLLRKDFVLERYQLLEARAWGADAALLIVAALSPAELARLAAEAAALGLEALVECHDEAEFDAALAAGARLVGINNRDLRSFRVDLGVSERLLPRAPAGVRVVVESGVRTVEDAARLRAAGAANFLVGEALVRAADPAALLGAIGALP